MKTLEKCSVCNHGKFHNEPCRHCLGLSEVKPDLIVDDYKPAMPQKRPAWLDKKVDTFKRERYQMNARARGVMILQHKKVLRARLRKDYHLTETQAMVVLDAWTTDNGLSNRVRHYDNDEVVTRMGTALQHLYDKYGKYERPQL